MPTKTIFGAALLCALILGLTAAGPDQVLSADRSLSADQDRPVIKTTITFGVQSEDDVTAFVSRFYRQCLDREPDPAGLGDWVAQLRTGARAGSDVARGFILSPEFVNRGLDDRAYLTVLYKAFFNREPDDAGLTGWLSALVSGSTRQDALNGFINSAEFDNLCRNYCIKSTPASPDPCTSADIPILKWPDDGSVQQLPVTLSWGAVQGAKGYEVTADCLSTRGATAQVKSMESGTHGGSFLSYNLEDPFAAYGSLFGLVKSVTWKVRAMDSSGNWQGYSQPRTFDAE